MAKKNGYNKPTRNRGEQIGERSLDQGQYDRSYDAQREEVAISRNRSLRRYENMYVKGQERDQRAMVDVQNLRSEFYGGLDPRRRQEMADGGMVSEDNNAIANLSSRPRHYEYPKAGYYDSPYIDTRIHELNDRFED